MFGFRSLSFRVEDFGFKASTFKDLGVRTSFHV